ncbi:hypothetical protein PN36_02155 [Candidatus Thiomargarita nelsonii]|uniref:Uncharacterized protein n=1 Tax=Candidatus Thiomargarita nelsonii TaxID=1003181 RepID=A0A4E0R5X2_9GAMM|nr:hypothetical protein PN36_02155 [Candidatus Thiomargarita nelsonii]
MAEEQQQTPFDLNKYLVDNQIDYAFPIAMSDTNIVFEQDGFFLQGKKAKALLLSKSQIKSLVPWFSQATKIAALYKADKNYFVLLEAGYHYMDFLQAVVVISHHTYQKALDSLAQNAPRWQVQVGCFGTSNKCNVWKKPISRHKLSSMTKPTVIVSYSHRYKPHENKLSNCMSNCKRR